MAVQISVGDKKKKERQQILILVALVGGLGVAMFILDPLGLFGEKGPAPPPPPPPVAGAQVGAGVPAAGAEASAAEDEDGSLTTVAEPLGELPGPQSVPTIVGIEDGTISPYYWTFDWQPFGIGGGIVPETPADQLFEVTSRAGRLVGISGAITSRGGEQGYRVGDTIEHEDGRTFRLISTGRGNVVVEDNATGERFTLPE